MLIYVLVKYSYKNHIYPMIEIYLVGDDLDISGNASDALKILK